MGGRGGAGSRTEGSSCWERGSRVIGREEEGRRILVKRGERGEVFPKNSSLLFVIPGGGGVRSRTLGGKLKA